MPAPPVEFEVEVAPDTVRMAPGIVTSTAPVACEAAPVPTPPVKLEVKVAPDTVRMTSGNVIAAGLVG